MLLGKAGIVRQFSEGHWKAYRGDERIGLQDLTVSPNSIDATLHPKILRPIVTEISLRDAKEKYECEELWISEEKPLRIGPNQFFLAAVQERFDCTKPVPDRPTNLDSSAVLCPYNRYYTTMITGRSTSGRIGLAVHVTAGFGDYGFDGAYTLELANLSQHTIVLYPGDRIAQVYFEEIRDVGANKYDGTYSQDHNDGPVKPVTGQGRS